ncbi:MAG: hypothetical protein Q8N90_00205 [bacterium]|nr:hypothetical protein [bacterium]
MRVIKTDVVKKVEKITVRPDSLGIRIALSIPVYFEFPEKKLEQCLNRLRQTTPQIKNERNRKSWERIIRTGELLLQNKEPKEIATALGLELSTIKCYLHHLNYQMNKNMTG